MEYDEHRRMYSINIGDHSHPIGFGNHATTPIHFHQSQVIHSEHPRLLVGSMIDGTVVTISPQIGAHTHSLQQPLHHAILPHQPQLSNQTIQQAQLNQHPVTEHFPQPTGHQTSIPHQMMRVAVERELTTHTQENENCMATNKDLGVVTQCERLVETGTNELVSSGSRWCLLCNESLPDTDSPEVIDIQSTTVRTTHRKLTQMLARLAGINIKNAHSTVMCQHCFSLIDEVDALEIKLADAKMEIQRTYKATLSIRQPNLKLVNGNYEGDGNDEPLLDSSASSGVDDDPADPDVTPYSLQNIRTNRTKKSKRKLTKTENGKNLPKKRRGRKRTSEGHKRSRGRPRKKHDQEGVLAPGEATIDCPCCQKVLPAKKYLSHLAIHRVFPCPFCRSIFKKKDIKTHLAEVHQEEVQYPCPECDQVCDTFMQLRRHCLVIHMGVEVERAQCPLCVKSFSSSNALKVHIDTIHSKNQLYQCQLCKESFNQRGNMRNHFRRVHEGEEAKKLNCSICSKGFICPSDLRKHVERVHLKIKKNQVPCKVCAKPFSDSRALKIHINAIHTREIQYPCPNCKMVFHSLTNMITHRRRIHSGHEARKHVCDICNKGFCSPSDLRTHVKVVHENVRKFICDICGQSFKVGSHLKYHRRKHTGETPYSCPHCDKSFHGPSHISDHIKKVHKTVYMGVNQRRRLNLPEDAPPPPPGILPSRHKVKQPEELPSGPSQVGIQPPQLQPTSATISHIHPNMMAYSSQPNHAIQATAVDPHTITHNQWWTVANY